MGLVTITGTETCSVYQLERPGHGSELPGYRNPPPLMAFKNNCNPTARGRRTLFVVAACLSFLFCWGVYESGLVEGSQLQVQAWYGAEPITGESGVHKLMEDPVQPHTSFLRDANAYNLTSSSNGKSYSHCSHSDKVEALICSVSLKPEGRWLEPFRSENRQMSVLYPFETPLIRIEAQACSCGKKVHIGTAKGADTSLVLRAGQSTVALFVTDDSHSKHIVFGNYSVKLYRNGTSFHSPEEAFAPQAMYNICRLYQDCDIHLNALLPCGLVSEQSPVVSWDLYVRRLHEKKLCDNAHHEGYWAVPCKSCHNRESCFWTQAKWITDECRYSTYDNVTSKLRSKLEGKTLLFYGDSTLRAMMFHLIQKVNGTLEEWVMIHDRKMFRNVNNRKTGFFFMYYHPILPKNDFSSLLHDFGKFKNSTDTVLMVGGVQWMNVLFLDYVKSELNRAGLSGIKVIVKGYGAGFKLIKSGPGLRLEEHQAAAKRNKDLMRHSLDLGYKFIDTFWMTSSRYKQLTFGKCACHFHSIIKLKNHPGSYSVVGPINAAYSDILLQLLTI